MQMRASIARALVNERTAPYGRAFRRASTRSRAIARRRPHPAVWKKQLTVIFVTHSIYEAVFLSTRVVVMSARPGRILAEVANDEPHPRSDAFRVTQKFAAYAKQLSEHLADASSRGATDL